MIKNNVLVAGSAGTIGRCVCRALAQLGVPFHTMDMHVGADFQIKPDLPNYRSCVRGHNLVISCLPYFCNKELAGVCISESIPYCDLGGRVDVSNAIHEKATRYEAQVFTDLGLAPGWVNIVADWLVSRLPKPPDTVEMLVGGLPRGSNWNSNPLLYERTWSLEGLLNEYRDDCIILRDGNIVTVPGMSGLRVEYDAPGLESFYTSGGASHSVFDMQKKGVKNCCYRTLRWNGHHFVMKWLMEHLNDEEIGKLLPLVEKSNDAVYLRVWLQNHDMWNSPNPEYEASVRANEEFSAMQQATAYPLVAAALLMDEMPVRPLTYADVPYEKFDKIVSDLLTD